MYKCLSQKPDDFIDEFHDNGFVNIEQAIIFFKNYPFEEELNQARNNGLHDRFSTLQFANDSNCRLLIWIESLEGIFLRYENGKQFSQFFVSNNFFENRKQLNVEYFINLFFLDKIEEEIILKVQRKANNINKQPIVFSFNDNPKKAKNLYPAIPWFCLTTFPFVYFYFNMEDITYLSLIFSLFWLPSCFLFLTYWRVNKNAIVKIDYSQKTISYEKDGKRIKFNRNEIDKCYIYEVNTSRLNILIIIVISILFFLIREELLSLILLRSHEIS